MKVTEAKFTRRFNVGQYEHEEYTVTAVVEDDDNAVEVLTTLKSDVAEAHSGNAPEAEEEETPEPIATKRGKKKSQPEEEEESTEESEEEETGDENSEPDDSANEEESEEEEEPAPVKKKAKKVFKKKPQVYQRANETHKDLFGKTITAVVPTWKKNDASKAKAKKVSIALEGTEFLDENGNVLASFKSGIKKLMAK